MDLLKTLHLCTSHVTSSQYRIQYGVNSAMFTAISCGTFTFDTAMHLTVSSFIFPILEEPVCSSVSEVEGALFLRDTQLFIAVARHQNTSFVRSTHPILQV